VIGDPADIAHRIKSVLPAGWFGDTSPVLDSILSGLSQTWAWIYDCLTYVKSQTRIRTASDHWLDLISVDYFHNDLPRHLSETDMHFRQRVLRELLRERGTRAALASALTDLTGRSPYIFEPSYCFDTGAYGSHSVSVASGLAYGVQGGWGSLALPFQCFVVAYRPIHLGIANVSGWNCPAGGYGSGTVEYADLALMEEQVSDQDICTAITRTLPIGVIAWTRISD
jgi:hypothetical protein